MKLYRERCGCGRNLGGYVWVVLNIYIPSTRPRMVLRSTVVKAIAASAPFHITISQVVGLKQSLEVFECTCISSILAHCLELPGAA